MNVKVRVTRTATEEELERLYRLGCASSPYQTRGNVQCFVATVAHEHDMEKFRALSCVLEVSKMPVYSISTLEGGL